MLTCRPQQLVKVGLLDEKSSIRCHQETGKVANVSLPSCVHSAMPYLAEGIQILGLQTVPGSAQTTASCHSCASDRLSHNINKHGYLQNPGNSMYNQVVGFLSWFPSGSECYEAHVSLCCLKGVETILRSRDYNPCHPVASKASNGLVLYSEEADRIPEDSTASLTPSHTHLLIIAILKTNSGVCSRLNGCNFLQPNQYPYRKPENC